MELIYIFQPPYLVVVRFLMSLEITKILVVCVNFTVVARKVAALVSYGFNYVKELARSDAVALLMVFQRF